MQLSDLDLNSTYSYADYLTWTFDERLELIKGKIFKMTPAPNGFHQEVSMTISNEFYNFLKKKRCKVFAAPYDVRLPKKGGDPDQNIFTVVQPDICVICDLSKTDFRGCTGAPDIVVEILSPSNNSKELKNKYDVYEESGVKEYWIVSPQDKTFLKYTLDDSGQYQPSKLLTLGDTIVTPVLPGFVLSVDTIFSEID